MPFTFIIVRNSSCRKVMFSEVSVHSVHGWGGVHIPQSDTHTSLGRHPLGQTHTPLGRHPLGQTHTHTWTDTPPGQTPIDRHSPGQTTPRQTPPGQTHTSLGQTLPRTDTSPHSETASAVDGTHPAGMHSCTH